MKVDDEDKIGSLYLKELVQRSILQIRYNQYNFHDPYPYNMHDLVHDLACFLSGGEFCRLEGGTLVEIPQNVRYISIPCSDEPVEIPILPQSVWAFILLDFRTEIINPESLYISRKNLRALDLSQGGLMKALPNFMGSLKMIRHLILVDGGQYQFTTSVSLFQLYNMNTLEHYSYGHHLALREIGHLINRRTLTLDMSRCGCNIRELRSMSKLRELLICGLGSVSSIEDAKEAQMQSKKHLRSLTFDFRVCSDPCPHILQPEPVTLSHNKLLESLQPNGSLTKLSIRYYDSHKYPRWLGSDSFLKLTGVCFCFCGSKHLPPLGGLPSLKYLTVVSMLNVEYIGAELISSHPSKGFPSLKQMELRLIENWLEWSGVDDGDFVRLCKLSIIQCPKLKSLPMVPFLSLASLHIHWCGTATIPAWFTLRRLSIRSCDCLSEVSTLPSLLDLFLGWCPTLRAVGSLPSLTSMKLYGINPSAVGFGSLSSVTSLEMSDDYYLKGRETIPMYEFFSPLIDLPSLECLQILKHGVTSLSLQQQNMPSLTKL